MQQEKCIDSLLQHTIRKHASSTKKIMSKLLHSCQSVKVISSEAACQSSNFTKKMSHALLVFIIVDAHLAIPARYCWFEFFLCNHKRILRNLQEVCSCGRTLATVNLNNIWTLLSYVKIICVTDHSYQLVPNFPPVVCLLKSYLCQSTKSLALRPVLRRHI
jgi:hypothetical protein